MGKMPEAQNFLIPPHRCTATSRYGELTLFHSMLLVIDITLTGIVLFCSSHVTTFHWTNPFFAPPAIELVSRFTDGDAFGLTFSTERNN